MPTFSQRSGIEVEAERLFDWHSRRGALSRLIPPWERIEVLEADAGLRDGDRAVLRVSNGPASWRWVTELRNCREGCEFTDRQLEGVFKRWQHRHAFIDNGDRTASLVDEVEYALPFAPVGSVLAGPLVSARIKKALAFRHIRTRNDLVRHSRAVAPRYQRVAVTGANGLVGRDLCAFLDAGGHDVSRLVRQPSTLGSGDIGWDPATARLAPSSLEGFDTIVHLAGTDIPAARWSPAHKRMIVQSRVAPTRLLAETLSRLKHPPRTLISASATGYYGDRGRDRLNEESEHGAGFTADMCRAWEAATDPAARAGIRVVKLRMGMVLSARGGALTAMLPRFNAGIGGTLGSGRQYVSWIAIDDLVGLIHHIMFDSSIDGVVNGVSPKPVTNRRFTKTLGRVLRRPTLTSLPSHVVRFMFGEMGESLLLIGARVLPAKARSNGFRFLYPELEDALRFELGR